MAIHNTYDDLSPETLQDYSDADNRQSSTETIGQRVLGLVETQGRSPEVYTPSRPDNVHHLATNIGLHESSGQGTIYQKAPDTRENRLALFTGKAETENRIEFIEQFSSDLLKLDKSRVRSSELATFCEAFPEWRYQAKIIKDKRYGVFRRANMDNLDLEAFTENAVERHIIWNAPELVVLVKDVYVRDLIKITDIEHYVETHAFVGVGEIEPDEDLMAKARSLSVTQRKVIETLFWPACEVANRMSITDSTVRTHIHNSMLALGLSSQRQLVLFGVQTGLVKLDHIESGKTQDLSDKERNILQHHYGDTHKEASAALGLAASTIRTHWHHIYAKIGAVNRNQAIMIAVKDGLIGLENKTVPTT